MEEQLSTEKYPHKLKADDFKELFLASNEEFEKRKAKTSGAEGIKHGKGEISIEDTEIEGTISIRNQGTEICKSLFFKNVKMDYFQFIRSDLPLVRDEIRAVFDFKGCDIKCILISTATIGDFSIGEKSHIGSIEISKSKVEQIHFGTSEINSVRINLKSSIACLQIQESITGDLFLSNSEIDSIKIEDSSTSAISIFKSHINKEFNINKSGTSNIRFTDSLVHNFSTEVSLTGAIDLSDVKVDVFHVKNNYCSFNFGKTIISDFQLSQCQVPTFRIDSACDINGYFTGGYFNKIDFSNTTIRSGSILSFSYSEVFSILTECFSMLGNLYFRKITKADKVFEYPTFEQISYLDLGGSFAKRIKEYRKKQYSKLKEAYEEECTKLSVKKPTIRFHLSSLGKTEFIDCPLGDFALQFNNSKINDCFVSGNSLPKDVQIVKAENFSIIEDNDKDSLTRYQQKASFYNQFKKIFEAQGDIYHATQFQAKWAEEQRKELGLRKKEEYKKPENSKWWSKIKIFFNSTSNDIFTLWLNKISNLHGESWARAFAFVFGSALIFYLLYLLTICRLFNGNSIDWNLFGYFFQYFNPAHDIRFIDENLKINGWTVFVDYLGRLFVAYGIYQFIAAFRKHTKKQ